MADEGEQRSQVVKVGIFDYIEREKKKSCRESMDHDLAELSLRLFSYRLCRTRLLNVGYIRR